MTPTAPPRSDLNIYRDIPQHMPNRRISPMRANTVLTTGASFRRPARSGRRNRLWFWHAVQGTPLSDLGLQGARADVGASVFNIGHTIQVEPTAPAGAITVAGTAFQFRQGHIHHLSEHVVNGQHAGSEMSTMTDFFDQVMEVAPEQPETRTPLHGTVQIASLLAAGERYHADNGSATTPPCAQSITLLIQAQPLVLDVGQAADERFVQIIGQNYRPAQPLNGRTVYLH